MRDMARGDAISEGEVWLSIRELISSSDWLSVRQGIELALSIDERFGEVLSDGLGISDEGRLEFQRSWIELLGVKIHNRENAALLILSLVSDDFCGHKRFDFSDAEFLSDVSCLSAAEGLCDLRLDNCVRLTDLGCFGSMRQLKRLSLVGLSSLKSSVDLSMVSTLERLSLEAMDEGNLSHLGHLRHLRSLSVRRCGALVNLVGVDSLVGLERLSLGGCKSLRDISNVSNLLSLRDLTVSGISMDLDLSTLGNLANLERLTITDCTGSVDISGSFFSNKITSVNFSGTHVTGLELLALLSNLEEASFSDATHYSAGDDSGDAELAKDLGVLLSIKNPMQNFSGTELKQTLVAMGLLVLFFDRQRFPTWSSVERFFLEYVLIAGATGFQRLISGMKLEISVAAFASDLSPEDVVKTYFWQKSPLGQLIKRHNFYPPWFWEFAKWARCAETSKSSS